MIQNISLIVVPKLCIENPTTQRVILRNTVYRAHQALATRINLVILRNSVHLECFRLPISHWMVCKTVDICCISTLISILFDRYVLLMCNIMPQDENDMEVNVDWPLLHNAVLWDINGQQKVFSQVVFKKKYNS